MGRGDLLPWCRGRAALVSGSGGDQIWCLRTRPEAGSGRQGVRHDRDDLRDRGWLRRVAWQRRGAALGRQGSQDPRYDADRLPGLEARSYGAADRVGPLRPGPAARPGDPGPRAAVRRVGAGPRPGARGPGRRVGCSGAVRTQPDRRHGRGRLPRAQRAARLAARIGGLAGGRARPRAGRRRPRRVAAGQSGPRPGGGGRGRIPGGTGRDRLRLRGGRAARRAPGGGVRPDRRDRQARRRAPGGRGLPAPDGLRGQGAPRRSRWCCGCWPAPRARRC